MEKSENKNLFGDNLPPEATGQTPQDEIAITVTETAPAAREVTPEPAKEETTITKLINNPALSKDGIIFKDFNELVRFSQMVAGSDLAPKEDKGKPANIFAKIQMGAEVGLTAMQSIHSFAIINNRPTMWGDAIPGLVYSSGLSEYIEIKEVGDMPDSKMLVKDFPKSYGFEVSSKRKDNGQESAFTFTVADATRAGLWNTNVWAKYPKIMLKNRARTFLLRDLYPDVFKGIHTTEEMRDVRDADFEVQEQTMDETLDKKMAEINGENSIPGGEAHE